MRTAVQQKGFTDTRISEVVLLPFPLLTVSGRPHQLVQHGSHLIRGRHDFGDRDWESCELVSEWLDVSEEQPSPHTNGCPGM